MRWLVGLVITTSAWASSPTVAHQGRVVDATGAPLNGAYDFTFRMYDSGGADLWSEEHTSVSVEDGFYSVSLGQSVALDTAWPQAESVGVQVGQGDEQSPRAPIRRQAVQMDSVSCADGEVLRYSDDGWSCGAARTYLGSLDVPATYSGTPSSWTKINPGNGFAASWGDYNQYLSTGQTLNLRLCLSYTDSGTGSGTVNVRFKDNDSSAVRWSTTLPTTASGSATMQSRCSQWATLGGQTSCTYSWSNTCHVEVTHSQDQAVILQRIWWEFSGV